MRAAPLARKIAVALGLAAAAAAGSAAARADGLLPPGLTGKFRGTMDAATGGRGGDFTVSIESTADRFTVRWPSRNAATFVPGARPEVFRTEDPANPLNGETVYWARVEGDALLVYSMQIDAHGGYDIRDYAYSPAPEGLDLTVHRVRRGADTETSTARLARYGD